MPDSFYHAAAIDGACAEQRIEFAYEICAGLVCLDFHGEPCLRCAPCKKIIRREHPDITFVDNSDGKLSVGDMRALCADAYIAPGEARHKVYIINFTDRLSSACQNALLKTLEEPPDKVHFLLLCDNCNALLQTVRSRASCFSLDLKNGSREKPQPEGKVLAAAEQICAALSSRAELEIFQAFKKAEALDNTQTAALFGIMRVIMKNAALYGEADCERIIPDAEASLGSRVGKIELCALADMFSVLLRRTEAHANPSALTGAACAMAADILKLL